MKTDLNDGYWIDIQVGDYAVPVWIFNIPLDPDSYRKQLVAFFRNAAKQNGVEL